jgi:hypothetical protein
LCLTPAGASPRCVLRAKATATATAKEEVEAEEVEGVHMGYTYRMAKQSEEEAAGHGADLEME